MMEVGGSEPVSPENGAAHRPQKLEPSALSKPHWLHFTAAPPFQTEPDDRFATTIPFHAESGRVFCTEDTREYY